MNFFNLFGREIKSVNVETNTECPECPECPEPTNKIYLLYGAKNSCGQEQSYLVAVFNDQTLAMNKMEKINKEKQLTNVGKSIICPVTNINEYHYRYFLIEWEMNKNNDQNIEELVFGKLPQLLTF